MAKNTVEIKNVRFDENGEPQFDEVTNKLGDVRMPDGKGGVTIDKGQRAEVTLQTKTIQIESGLLGKDVVKKYPNSRLTIWASDMANQNCPESLLVGHVVLVKNKQYELVYAPIPIEGWTTKDVAKPTDPSAQTTLYPDHIKSQDKLMDLILSHLAVHGSPFVSWTLEHPPEIQAELDLKQLETEQESLEERERLAQEKFLKEKALLEKKMKDAMKKKAEVERLKGKTLFSAPQEEELLPINKKK